MAVKNRFADLLPEIAGWRQEFHSFPELRYEEHRTSARVAELLREFGVDEIETGVGGTGVVGRIKGRANTKGRAIALRADMDALPILEANDLPYASQNQGVMHACGHDGHTAMLLGAAKYLCETRNFDGDVILLFQPAEEGGAGARAMLEAGLLERFNFDEVYGMHNWPGVKEGVFCIREGAFFAATDQFEVVVKGQGGHGGKPHETLDPTVTASQIVVALQTIASRNLDPVDQLVVSVTSFETASKAFNVIPSHVTLRGTVRTLSNQVRVLAKERIHEIMTQIAAAFRCTAEINYMPGYPVMINAEANTDYARDVAVAVSGSVSPAPLVMGAEDFAFFLEARPGAYICVGNGEQSASLHTNTYNFNDDIIPAGCSWYAGMAESRLAG